MTRSSDITSFTEHRNHLRDHLNRVRESGRPLFVTVGGETDAVVMSPATYDALAAKAELLDSLARIDKGMADLKAGRGRNLKSAIHDVAKGLGVQLDG